MKKALLIIFGGMMLLSFSGATLVGSALIWKIIAGLHEGGLTPW